MDKRWELVANDMHAVSSQRLKPRDFYGGLNPGLTHHVPWRGGAWFSLYLLPTHGYVGAIRLSEHARFQGINNERNIKQAILWANRTPY